MNKKFKTKSEQFGVNGFPKSKEVVCFKCEKEFFVKYVLPRGEYSKKNYWSYWSGEKGEKYICDKDLLDLYKNKQFTERPSLIWKKGNKLELIFITEWFLLNYC